MSNKRTITAAAIQLDTDIGNTVANLESSERLAMQAVSAGAQWIALPEFFNTGVCWDPSLVEKVELEDGPSANFLKNFSKDHLVVIGGSFMCRLPDGTVRNRYLCFDRGRLVGKHDKDLPTMWENAFYEGADTGDIGYLGEVEGQRVGAAVCWEFIRTQTAERLRGKVDVVIGGSHWWSMPENWPAWLIGIAEDYNSDNLMRSVQESARLIGAPIIHGSHCNQFECEMPGFPYPLNRYKGILEGNAAIVDAKGTILARRYKEEGEGYVCSEVEMGSCRPLYDIPKRFWLRQRSLIAAFSWHYHGFIGRRWYRQNVKQRV